jgi:hypothetical protein
MKEVAMPDPIADFFAQLARGGAGPLLGDVTATVRFDVTYPGYVRIWRVAIDGDRIEVTDSPVGADCVVGAERAVFEELVTGRRNAMAALLRGQLTLTGDADVLVRLQRLFPGPGVASRPDPTADPEMAATGGRRLP